MEGRGASRVVYIDWLRIFAVLLLFPFHTLRVFNDEDFYVKALPVTEWVDGVLWFISIWHMPLLFLLAGCSTYLALHKRSSGQYALERTKRLLVPLVFGIFILIPPQTWYGARFNAGYAASFRHYLASGDFLRWNIQDGGDYYGGFGVGQLWFIMFLLIISMLVLPLLVWARRESGARRARALNRRLARPAWWIAAVIVLFAARLIPEIPGGPLVYYLVLFVLGFLVMCDPRFIEAAERHRWTAVVAGAAISLACVIWAPALLDAFPSSGHTLVLLLLKVVIEAATWLVLVGVLGLGKHYLGEPPRSSGTRRTLAYLAEGSYPVYILHQTVIVAMAFYLVSWSAPQPVLWAILLVASVAGTFTLYEIVRRVGTLRFLFGMKARSRVVRPSRLQGGS